MKRITLCGMGIERMRTVTDVFILNFPRADVSANIEAMRICIEHLLLHDIMGDFIAIALPRPQSTFKQSPLHCAPTKFGICTKHVSPTCKKKNMVDS